MKLTRKERKQLIQRVEERGASLDLALTNEQFLKAWTTGESLQDTSSVTEDEARSVPGVYASNKLIASNCAKLNLHVVGIKDQQPIETQPRWTRSLVAPGQTRWNFLFRIFDALLYNGTAYVEILRRDPKTGRPADLLSLPHGQCGVTRAKDDPRRIVVTHTPEGSGTSRKLEEWNGVAGSPGEVIVIRWDDHGNLEGRNPVSTLGDSVLVSRHAQTNAGSTFLGGGVPPFVMAFEGASEDELEKISEQYDKERSSLRRRNKGMFFSMKPEEIHEFRYTAGEQQLVETRAFQNLEHARVNLVPPQLVGDSSTTWGTGVQGMIQALLRFGMQSYLTCVEDALSMCVSTMTEVRFDISSVLRGDPEAEAKELSLLVRSGIMTPNDARERLGLPQHADGDVLHAPKGAAQDDSGEGTGDIAPPAV